MWKLFATVLVMSDTGSVAVSSIAADFANHGACVLAANQLFPAKIEQTLQGHVVTIRTSAECRSDGTPIVPPPVRFNGPPPVQFNIPFPFR
jgi:hypothetical protein